MAKIKHTYMFLTALRTATLFFAGFLAYEILVELEKIWNLKNPNKEVEHFYKRIFYKFLIILLVDLTLLYILFFLTGEHF